MYYVTMQITLHIPEFARKERHLHCDVVHITTKWVFRLTLDHAIGYGGRITSSSSMRLGFREIPYTTA